MIVLEIHRANPAPALPTNKNAPHGCEAFGAENETRTVSCNTLKISDLEKAEKTTGETFVAFQDV